MSVLQKSELRYMKRTGLEEEARVVGNYYRDIIRSYGLDCVYNKLNTSFFDNFKLNIDQNAILQRAYGINLNPDYTCSAEMITFPEIEQDIFQLNKYGMNPNTDVTFYFDSTDFACALAEQCGQYKEYKIKETAITCEIPNFTNEIRWCENPYTGERISSYVSADNYPYKLGLGYAEFFTTEILDGKLSVELSGYEYDKETTIVCDPYEHNDVKLQFSSNPDLYKSLQHRIHNSKYVQPLLFLTFEVNQVKTGPDTFVSILRGTVHGSVLFYSLDKIGKYLDKIHPEVGDLITIDFPDKDNAEKYEITDCFDKQLTQDGISPLLHKYVWKCKARRYVNNYDDVVMTEADKRAEEKRDFNQMIDDEVAKSVSLYPNDEDKAYGGYEAIKDTYDQKKLNHSSHQIYDFLDDGTAIDLVRFDVGSRLVTTGYELLFIDCLGNAYQLTKMDHKSANKDSFFESNTRWLKASDDCVVFVDVEGTPYKLVEDELATQGQLEMCLNSLFEQTLDPGSINHNKDNFYKFKGTRTILWATQDQLFCKLASNGHLYKLV